MAPSKVRAFLSLAVVTAALLIFGLASCGSSGRAGVTASTDPKPDPKTEWVELPKAPLAPRAERSRCGPAGRFWSSAATRSPAYRTPIVPLRTIRRSRMAPRSTRRRVCGDHCNVSGRVLAASTAVLGDDVYFLEPHAFLRYSVAGNLWAAAPRPTNGGVGNLVAVDDAIVAFAGTDARRGTGSRLRSRHEHVEGAAGRPLSPSFDRVMTGLGSHLYLFDHESYSNPGSERPSLTRAARLDLDSGKWERLPDSEILGTGPWFADGTRSSRRCWAAPTAERSTTGGAPTPTAAASTPRPRPGRTCPRRRPATAARESSAPATRC